MTIYCITAPNKQALANMIIEKWGQGLARRGRAIAIGGGYWVQRMVERSFL